jgi:hypothetical protein
MKINRWWYSNKQNEITRRDRRFHQVLVDDKWLAYTEWTISKNAKCSFDDAILIAESIKKLPTKLTEW